MTDSNDPLLRKAQQAIASGNRPEARRLLQRYSRENQDDYRPWLWLAGLADSPAQSLAYLERAEALQPDNPTIQKAKAWANQRLAADKNETRTAPDKDRDQRSRSPIPAGSSTGTPETISSGIESSKRSKSSRTWLAPATGLILLAFLCGVIAALISRGVLPIPVLAAEPETTESVTSSQIKIVADVSDAEATQDAILPLQSPTPTATNTPLPTPTLQPTFTPEPTATPVPTVVVFPGGSEIPQIVSVAEGERWIDVNLTTQTLNAYEGATPVFTTLISSGTADHPTVTGQFRVWLRYESQTMNGRLLGYDYYLENVPYVMYFYNDYALHGTFWHNNFGTPMSHGCVNLATPDAEWLFNWSSYGTLVNVHY